MQAIDNQQQSNVIQVKNFKPNTYELNIIANNSPVVLEKMLQVARYRGFTVNEMEVKPRVCDQTNITELLINLSVQSTNTVDLLTRQLEKVFDITKVQKMRPLDTIKQACNMLAR